MTLTLPKLLQQIGLSTNEANVFLISCTLGAQPASVIAEKVKLNRITTYNTLKSLVKKGLMFQHIRNSLQYFSAESSEKLLTFADIKTEEWKHLRNKLEDAVCELKSPYLKTTPPPMVKTYLGYEGLKMIFQQARFAEDILFFTSLPQGMDGEYLSLWERWFTYLNAHPSARIYIQESTDSKQTLFQTKLGLSLSYTFCSILPFPCDVLITNEHVTFIHYNRQIEHAIQIHSTEICTSMKDLLLSQMATKI